MKLRGKLGTLVLLFLFLWFCGLYYFRIQLQPKRATIIETSKKSEYKSDDQERNVALNNGVIMPLVGLGTAALRSPAESINYALDAGYRLLDSASTTGPWYRSEVPIGEVIKSGRFKRDDLFITTKLHPADHGYASAKKSFEISLETLQTDYIDLYLIHFPRCWDAICSKSPEALYKKTKYQSQ
eukprot:TRINITY_DN1390_c0_g2_i1.p1 TRINITY_DN1390_c0_g2~~TRINITY_DN1390_c0_g2_i1.p1  ORF type:complete len:184 (-),score=21.31 TRINITY_DN1390_c0_g2_i1:562-1113(-)